MHGIVKFHTKLPKQKEKHYKIFVLIVINLFCRCNKVKHYSKTSLRRWPTRRSPMLQQANNLDLLRWETLVKKRIIGTKVL
ncbi:hypothetical protein BpHYR1_007049 [Brachionus plicatilis]|uniref:Uncharacterized protein n=1 Tax=Brachionus plicatilis TaxID=10195 RepID=A0A3M7S891_BRAPC|nr:hypothetical protein BpHYR1_007049 [Brachionus plicatilis]